MPEKTEEIGTPTPNDLQPVATPPSEPEQLPADHPLVTAFNEQKLKNAELRSRLDEVEPKASKLDEIEEANKSELEKAVARAEEAEKKAADEAKARVRAEVSATSEVPVEFLQFDLPKEELEGLAQKLKDWRNSREKQMPHTPALPENTPPEPTGDLEAQITEAEKAGNHLLAIQLRQQLATKKSEKP